MSPYFLCGANMLLEHVSINIELAPELSKKLETRLFFFTLFPQPVCLIWVYISVPNDIFLQSPEFSG